MFKFAKNLNFRCKNFVTAANFVRPRPFANCNCVQYAHTLTPACTVPIPWTSSVTVDPEAAIAMASISFEVRSRIRRPLIVARVTYGLRTYMASQPWNANVRVHNVY